MNQENATILLGILGFLVLWTGTAIGFATWLNTKLNSLLPVEYYEQRHASLENRVKELELWRAARNGMVP